MSAFDEDSIPAIASRPARAHHAQSYASPPFITPPAVPPPRHFFPEPYRIPGRPARAHLYQFFATSPGIKTTIYAGFGAAGSATFILRIEPGAKVSFTWQTGIIPSDSGREQRESRFGYPKRRFEGSAFLLDASSRDARGSLQRSAAAGATFLLALPFEELSFTADSSAQTVTVGSTTQVDWVRVGQRVAVVGGDGTTMTAVVQASTSTTIRLDATPGALGRRGCKIMPLVQVLLEPQQGFARYPVNVDLWTVRAQANVYGWCGVDAMGANSQITTFTAGIPVATSLVSELDLIVWDRVNTIDGTASEAMLSKAELVDTGAIPFGIGQADAPAWARTVKLRSDNRADWYWFQSFLRLCRGQQRSWLLSTNRPDLVFVSSAGASLTIKSSSVLGSGDYVGWYASTAHRRFALTKTNNTVQYVEVTSAPVDNLDGTLTLTLDSTVTGTVSKISFLELVRFERGTIEATWQGATFSVDEVVRTVLDDAQSPTRGFFDVETAVNFAYSGVPPDVPPSTQTLAVPVGKVIGVHWTSDRSLNFSGIHMAGGNVDQTIVYIMNVNNNSSSCILQHDNTGAAAADRLWNSGLGSISGTNKTTVYRFRQAADGGVGKWIQIG